MTNSMPEFDPEEQEIRSLLREPAKSCPPMELLLACGQQVLPAEAEQAVQRHLDHCSLCAQLIRDLGTLPQEELSPLQHERIATKLPRQPKTDSPRWGLYAGSIAAAAIVAVGLLALRARHTSDPAPANAIVSPGATAPYVARAVPEPRLVPLPAPGAEAISPLTRGAQGNTEPETTLLLPAFTAYNRGDYASAERRFTGLRGGYPHSALIPLYLGVSQLLLHHDADAHATLTQAVHEAKGSTLNAARWYEAIAAQRTGAPETRSLYQSLCAESASRYSAESCRMVATLP